MQVQTSFSQIIPFFSATTSEPNKIQPPSASFTPWERGFYTSIAGLGKLWRAAHLFMLFINWNLVSLSWNISFKHFLAAINSCEGLNKYSEPHLGSAWGERRQLIVFILPMYFSHLKPGNFRLSEEDSVLYMDQAKLQTFHTLLRQ